MTTPKIKYFFLTVLIALLFLSITVNAGAVQPPAAGNTTKTIPANTTASASNTTDSPVVNTTSVNAPELPSQLPAAGEVTYFDKLITTKNNYVIISKVSQTGTWFGNKSPLKGLKNLTVETQVQTPDGQNVSFIGNAIVSKYWSGEIFFNSQNPVLFEVAANVTEKPVFTTTYSKNYVLDYRVSQNVTFKTFFDKKSNLSIQVPFITNTKVPYKKFVKYATYKPTADPAFTLMQTAALSQDPTFSACGNLNTPNTVYTLTQDLATGGDCIEISADNVTLDGAGYFVNGVGKGIFIDPNVANPTIENINLYQFQELINLEGDLQGNLTIDNSNLTLAGQYALWSSGQIHGNVTITNTNTSFSSQGLYFPFEVYGSGLFDHDIFQNISNNGGLDMNQNWGFSVGGNVVVNNSFFYGNPYGIYSGTGVNGNVTFENDNFDYNQNAGIYFTNPVVGDFNISDSNYTHSPSGYGVYIQGSSAGNGYFGDLNVSYNSNVGFYVSSGFSGNESLDNLFASSNNNYGFLLGSTIGQNIRIVDSVFSDNQGPGINYGTVNGDSYIRNVTASNNRGNAGLYSSNQIAGNFYAEELYTVNNTNGQGVYINIVQENTTILNSVFDNNSQQGFQVSSQHGDLIISNSNASNNRNSQGFYLGGSNSGSYYLTDVLADNNSGGNIYIGNGIIGDATFLRINASDGRNGGNSFQITQVNGNFYMKDVFANNNSNAVGIEFNSAIQGNVTVDNVQANYNGNGGLQFNQNAQLDATFTNINASYNGNTGVYFPTTFGFGLFENIYANNNGFYGGSGSGIQFNGLQQNTTVRNIQTNNNRNGYGVYFGSTIVHSLDFEDASINNNTQGGLYVATNLQENVVFRNIQESNSTTGHGLYTNGGTGITYLENSEFNQNIYSGIVIGGAVYGDSDFINVQANNNGYQGISLNQLTNNFFYNVQADNNGWQGNYVGIYFGGNINGNNTLWQVESNNNTNQGIELQNQINGNNNFRDVTTNSNNNAGIYISTVLGTETYDGVFSNNNTYDGMLFTNSRPSFLLKNSVITFNGQSGVRFTSNTNYANFTNDTIAQNNQVNGGYYDFDDSNTPGNYINLADTYLESYHFPGDYVTVAKTGKTYLIFNSEITSPGPTDNLSAEVLLTDRSATIPASATWLNVSANITTFYGGDPSTDVLSILNDNDSCSVDVCVYSSPQSPPATFTVNYWNGFSQYSVVLAARNYQNLDSHSVLLIMFAFAVGLAIAFFFFKIMFSLFHAREP